MVGVLSWEQRELDQVGYPSGANKTGKDLGSAVHHYSPQLWFMRCHQLIPDILGFSYLPAELVEMTVVGIFLSLFLTDDTFFLALAHTNVLENGVILLNAFVSRSSWHFEKSLLRNSSSSSVNPACRRFFPSVS